MSAWRHFRWLVPASVFLVVATFWPPPVAGPAVASGKPVPVVRKDLVPPRPAPVTLLPVAQEGARLNTPETGAGEDLAILDLLLSQYRRQFDGNPVGDNLDISAALRGENPKRLAYLPKAGPFLDPTGQLLDRWGTPYFFHALAGNRMEIRSAGPDLELWTADDLVDGPGDSFRPGK
jgi:hypothetical protein